MFRYGEVLWALNGRGNRGDMGDRRGGRTKGKRGRWGRRDKGDGVGKGNQSKECGIRIFVCVLMYVHM